MAGLTPGEIREIDHQTARDIPADDVWVHLEVLSIHLDDARNQAEILKDRPDLDDAERDVAGRIFSGLEGWSELIFDGIGDEDE